MLQGKWNMENVEKGLGQDYIGRTINRAPIQPYAHTPIHQCMCDRELSVLWNWIVVGCWVCVCTGPEGVVQFEARHWNPFLACGQWQHFQLGQANCVLSKEEYGGGGWGLTLNRIVCLVNHGSVSAAVRKGLSKDSTPLHSPPLYSTVKGSKTVGVRNWASYHLEMFSHQPSGITGITISHNDRNQATHGQDSAAININKDQEQNYEIINITPPFIPHRVALKILGIFPKKDNQRWKRNNITDFQTSKGRF